MNPIPALIWLRPLRTLALARPSRPKRVSVPRHRVRGTTLIEVILVVAIIALVAGAASVGGLKAWELAVRKTALGDARAIRSAVKTHWLTEGTQDCPTVEQLVSAGLLDQDGRKADPWGTAWRLTCVDSQVTVSSAGRDKQWGNDDDISAPEKGQPVAPAAP